MIGTGGRLSVVILVAALGAWMFLGESLSLLQVVGTALASAGVAMVVYFRGVAAKPDHATRRGILCGALGALAMSVGVLLNKRGLGATDAMTASCLRLSGAVVALALVAAWRRDLMPDLRRLLQPAVMRRLVPASIIGTFLGLWLMSVGIKHTQSAVANALHSTTPLFTLPIALLILKERMGRWAIAGSFVAVGGVFLLFL